MNVIPVTPADLRYNVNLQEGCIMNFPETPIADLLLDDPSVNPPWNQSFMSMLMSDQQIAQPADADLSFAKTLDIGVRSTREDSSVKSQSTRSDLWSSDEEEANYLASLGLGVSSSSEDYSSTSVDDSWSMMEDQMLRAAMADNRVMEQSVIAWESIAEALPWRTPLEVFNRANQMLQSIQRDLSIVMMSQQHQQQQMPPSSPPREAEEEKRQQQQIRQVRKRWSKEEDDKFRVGVERYGWGNWKRVAALIPGRTVPQVISHAQHIRKHPKKTKGRTNLRSSL